MKRVPITDPPTKGCCKLCGEFIPHSFLVNHELWKQVIPEDGVVCIFCFQKRLGRPLTLADFTVHPINEVWFFASTLTWGTDA
jgi:hypothetical protein